MLWCLRWRLFGTSFTNTRRIVFMPIRDYGGGSSENRIPWLEDAGKCSASILCNDHICLILEKSCFDISSDSHVKMRKTLNWAPAPHLCFLWCGANIAASLLAQRKKSQSSSNGGKQGGSVCSRRDRYAFGDGFSYWRLIIVVPKQDASAIDINKADGAAEALTKLSLQEILRTMVQWSLGGNEHRLMDSLERSKASRHG